MNEFNYRPPECGVAVEKSTLNVKFSRNITYLESFLKANNIDYKLEDLEDTPLGKGIVVRQD